MTNLPLSAKPRLLPGALSLKRLNPADPKGGRKERVAEERVRRRSGSRETGREAGTGVQGAEGP